MTDYELLSVMMASFAGAFVFLAIFGIAVYVLYGMSHMKALKAMGYDKAWAAWVPFFNTYALADCIPETKEKVEIFGISIPGTVFKFWWLIGIVATWIPVVGSILSLVINFLGAGYCYTSIYSNLEGKSKDEVKVVGHISGLINIVAIVKFFTYKK